MGKRKQTHEFSDQYGEHKSQDREEHMGFTKGTSPLALTSGSTSSS